MRNTKKLLSVGIALAMVMGMTVGAFAEETTGTAKPETTLVDSDGVVTLTNTMYIDENLTVPKVSYKYSTVNDEKPASVTADISVPDVTIEFDGDTVSDGKVVKTGTIDLSKDAIGYKVAGKYNYVITETKTETGISGTMTHTDTDKYEVSVYVKNYINSEGVKDVKVAGITIFDPSTETKVEAVEFDETYTDMTDLEVSKTVSGDYADLTTEFEYEITFVLPATVSESSITEASGKATAATGNLSFTFKLKDAESLSFNNIPVGTKYTIKETQKSDFKGKVEISYADGTTAPESIEKDKGIDIEAADKLAAEKKEGTNKAAFTNIYEDITITGVVTNNLPFVMMILVAGLAIIGFAAISIRRRR